MEQGGIAGFGRCRGTQWLACIPPTEWEYILFPQCGPSLVYIRGVPLGKIIVVVIVVPVIADIAVVIVVIAIVGVSLFLLLIIRVISLIPFLR